MRVHARGEPAGEDHDLLVFVCGFGEPGHPSGTKNLAL
jgi:hypothetical protein